MRVLALGDVCGELGCDMLLKTLPRLKKEKNIDFTVVNGENSASSNGISKASAELIFSAGADVITGGNHSLTRKDIREYLDSNPFLLRPDNLTSANYGSGYCLVDMGQRRVCVINLLGQVYLDMHNAENPFVWADRLIERAKTDNADIIIVDFHAETTSEKRAMGFYLDGKVSAVFGTHTHVQTSDLQILPYGTAYITDLGMTGPLHSVLGIEPSIIIDRFKNGTHGRFLPANSKCSMEGFIFETDDKTGKVTSVEIVKIHEK